MVVRLRPLLILALALVVATNAARAQLPAAVQNPAEQAAYTNAINIKDATKRAETLEIFLAWYPSSVLRIDA